MNIFTNIDRAKEKIPLFFILLILSLIIFNLIILYSVAGCNFYPWCYKQMIFFFLFIPIMGFIILLDLRLIFSYSYIFYFLILLLLIYVEFFGYKAMGAKRWINLFITKIQPSELAKISLVMMLARYFNSLLLTEIFQIKMLIPPILSVLIFAFLIIKQPDLGTGILLILVAITMFFMAGVKSWKFLLGLITSLLSIPIIWKYLHQYQKKRILTFLYPENDILGDGYNIMQSKIAIGSGGFLGKGICSGTQSQLNFLPEYQTDFIFSAIIEEFGFLGGFTLCSLYSSIIAISIYIALNTKNHYSKLLVIGIISIFSFHVFINIGMVMGIFPIVGIPLPLMSYGRTIMGSMLIGFALIINVHINNNIKL